MSMRFRSRWRHPCMDGVELFILWYACWCGIQVVQKKTHHWFQIDMVFVSRAHLRKLRVSQVFYTMRKEKWEKVALGNSCGKSIPFRPCGDQDDNKDVHVHGQSMARHLRIFTGALSWPVSSVGVHSRCKKGKVMLEGSGTGENWLHSEFVRLFFGLQLSLSWFIINTSFILTGSSRNWPLFFIFRSYVSAIRSWILPLPPRNFLKGWKYHS